MNTVTGCRPEVSVCAGTSWRKGDMTERDFNLAHARAREEGIPYQTLLSSVIHKYLSGRLTEKK